jgi:hypothetical protein
MPSKFVYCVAVLLSSALDTSWPLGLVPVPPLPPIAVIELEGRLDATFVTNIISGEIEATLSVLPVGEFGKPAWLENSVNVPLVPSVARKPVLEFQNLVPPFSVRK